MRKNNILFAFITLIIITGLISGCASFQRWLYSVHISTEGNLSSVLAGGTLKLRASGRDIIWTVSPNSSGSQPVSNGTFISPSGLLTVASGETASVLYVTATSTRDELFDIKQVRIVTVNAVNISPDYQTVVAGRTSQFRAQVTGSNNPDNAVTWKVSSNPAGTGTVTQGTSINSNGLLTISVNESLRTLYIVAASMVDPTKSSSVSATVVVPTVTQVTVSSSSQTARAGSTLRFTASVAGTYQPASTVKWTVSSNAAGTGAVTPGTSINSDGLLTIASNESLSVLYITATSTVDTTKSGSVSVSVIVPVVNSVTVTPSNQTVIAGNSFQFSSSVAGTNNPNTSVKWTVSSNAAGTGAVTQGTRINSDGLLTVSANETAKVLYVFATSVFNPAVSGSVYITVTPAPVIQPPNLPGTTPPNNQPTIRPADNPPANTTLTVY
jgi:hypothetical protein